MAFKITKWCAAITDDHKDKTVCPKPKELNEKFRLLDDDKVIYAYGYSNNSSSFAPLDQVGSLYGAVDIQYKNPKTGAYETL